MSEPDLSVVIVNWNVRDLLAACLESVRAATEAAQVQAEIWAVDNASHDGSVALLSQRFPEVQLIASPINLGFGGGSNLALRAMGFADAPVPSQLEGDEAHPLLQGAQPDPLPARSLPRYVLFLNPDTTLPPEALGEMVRFMERHPRAGVCGPRLVYGDGRFQHSAYRFPTLAQTWFDFWPINWRLTASWLNGRYPRRLYEGQEPFAIDHPLGAAMLFRREVIQDTRGFDLDYHMYVEEIDWCMRVKDAGWEVYCVPTAEVVHYHGQSTRQVRPQMAVALWRSRYILFRKHYSPLYRWLVRRIIRAGMRSEIRRTRDALRRGDVDPVAAEALIGAYRQVLAL